MTTTLLLELFAGFCTAFIALWMIALNRPGVSVVTPPPASPESDSRGSAPFPPPALRQALQAYLLREGRLASLGLLILRLAIGAMMIHHGQDKLGHPQAFADNYVVPLHLPFPLVLAHAAGYAEIFGSWLLILGLLSPLGALALSGTMTVAAYHHILTSGLNIYVLELVVLYLGGSLALLLVGPGRFSFDAGLVAGLLSDATPSDGSPSAPSGSPSTISSGSPATYGMASEAG